MACGALLRCRLIKQDRLAIHLLEQFVAAFTLHVAVNALEREACPTSVVEQGRLPFRSIVAVGAWR